MKIHTSILVLSDLHSPFMHIDTVPFLKAVKAKYKPKTVICIGDEIDGHSWSYHEHNPDLDGPNEELKKAIDKLKPIYTMFPKVTVLESNHGSLFYRKAITAGLPRDILRGYREIIKAPEGWSWIDKITLQTPLGPVHFVHGKSAAAGKLSQLYGISTVEGHYHESASITYTSTPERLTFGLKTGCLVDDNALSMAYNKLNAKRPIISLAVLLDGIPIIVPMLLNKKGRWIGKL